MADFNHGPKETLDISHVEEDLSNDVDVSDLKAGLRGQAATDEYGQPLVQFDPVEEKRLVRKIDLCVIPTVALLYLFCFTDRANIGTAWIFLLECITLLGVAFFSPTIIRTIYPTYPVVRQQLMTVPPSILGAIFVIASALLSWKTDRRNPVITYSAVPVMVGYVMFLATENAKARYGAIFILATGAFNGGTLCNAQVSAKVVSDTARSSAIGTNVMFGNIGGLIATWAFPPTDGPNFPIGNGLNLAAQATVLISGLAIGFCMSNDNKKRKQVDVHAKIGGSNQKVGDLDWRHPGFQWRP